MERHDNAFIFSVDGSSMDFVLNNGRDDWDQPYPSDDKRENYTIKQSGEFLLKNGTISKMP